MSVELIDVYYKTDSSTREHELSSLNSDQLFSWGNKSRFFEIDTVDHPWLSVSSFSKISLIIFDQFLKSIYKLILYLD